MIKKQLGFLAGSILLASSANAAITASSGVNSDSSVILVLSNAGAGAFVVDSGISAGDLAAGQGFSVDVSAAAAALGGIDSYSVLGVLGGSDATSYNSIVGYVDGGSGIIYAAPSGALLNSENQLGNDRNAVNDYISFVSAGGLFANGTPGDLDQIPLNAVLFGGTGALTAAGNLSSVFLQQLSVGTNSTNSQTEITILTPPGSGGVSLVGTTFSVTGGAAAVPVPAAAWLFGSALLGLGVIRRKSN